MSRPQRWRQSRECFDFESGPAGARSLRLFVLWRRQCPHFYYDLIEDFWKRTAASSWASCVRWLGACSEWSACSSSTAASRTAPLSTSPTSWWCELKIHSQWLVVSIKKMFAVFGLVDGADAVHQQRLADRAHKSSTAENQARRHHCCQIADRPSPVCLQKSHRHRGRQRPKRLLQWNCILNILIII